MYDNFVDNSAEKGYNQDNSKPVDDEGYEVIRMDGKPPLNNPECEHEFAEDPTDTIGDKVAWMCIKPKCGIGHWRLKENKNPS